MMRKYGMPPNKDDVLKKSAVGVSLSIKESGNAVTNPAYWKNRGAVV
jgi:hypothetical protein